MKNVRTVLVVAIGLLSLLLLCSIVILVMGISSELTQDETSEVASFPAEYTNMAEYSIDTYNSSNTETTDVVDDSEQEEQDNSSSTSTEPTVYEKKYNVDDTYISPYFVVDYPEVATVYDATLKYYVGDGSYVYYEDITAQIDPSEQTKLVFELGEGYLTGVYEIIFTYEGDIGLMRTYMEESSEYLTVEESLELWLNTRQPAE